MTIDVLMDATIDATIDVAVLIIKIIIVMTEVIPNLDDTLGICNDVTGATVS